MTWMTWLIAIIGGMAGGLSVGVAQVFAAHLIVGWRRHRADAREARVRAEVAKEWCVICGQRRDDGDHALCRGIERAS